MPQGSVLRPFLFLVYMNDMPAFLPLKSIIYADDTTLVTVAKSLEEIKETTDAVLEKCIIWLHKNKLILNNKTWDYVLLPTQATGKSEWVWLCQTPWNPRRSQTEVEQSHRTSVYQTIYSSLPATEIKTTSNQKQTLTMPSSTLIYNMP